MSTCFLHHCLLEFPLTGTSLVSAVPLGAGVVIPEDLSFENETDAANTNAGEAQAGGCH